jgi:hypothetical protein
MGFARVLMGSSVLSVLKRCVEKVSSGGAFKSKFLSVEMVSEFVDGDFSFVRDIEERLMLSDAWCAIEAADCWGALMKQDQIDGYMFSKDLWLKRFVAQGH